MSMKLSTHKTHWFAFALVVSAALLPMQARADVKLATIFCNHLVLQRDMPVPIWGWADPGEAVSVSFAGQKKSATADAAGKWMVHLAKLPANANPQTLTVTGKNTLTVSDVLIGDVWMCSGQSNMTYRMGYDKDYYAAEIAAANDPNLRCFLVDFHNSPTPEADLQPSAYQNWSPANPDSVASMFPVVGYYFGLELRKSLGIPIGLIHSSYGATPAEAWVSREGLGKDPELNTMADKQIANMAAYPDNVKAFAANVAAWEEKYSAKDAGNTGEAKGWTKPDFDDSAWKTVTVPMNFSQIGLKAGGAVWLRKTIDVPASSAGKWLNLKFNYSSDDYTPYFNGTAVKGGEDWPKFFSDSRGFWIPGNLVKEGKNTLAVRVFSHTKDGGLSVRTGDFGIPLDNDWRYTVEFANPELPADAWGAFPHSPYAVPQYTSTYLFNAMVHPLLPFPIKGVIWYQGESNTSRAYQYRTLLPALIADWRGHWGEGTFPFYIVQLANFMEPAQQPTDTNWADLREAQLLTATHDPASGLAVTIDIGDKDNIHPKDKIDVGKRLALIALAKTYGHKIEYMGPLYASSAVEGSAIRIKFNHLGGGLVAKGGEPLKQFAIAGADQKFVWADAHIDGDTVVVSSPQVPQPVAVRYAWGDNPEGCNLYNAAGLPASPFRTDDWPGVTVNNH